MRTETQAAKQKITVYSATKDALSGTDAKEKGLVWLQGIGWCQAKPLSDFQLGEVMVWNTGSTSILLELVRNAKGAIIGMVEAYTDRQGNTK